MIKSVHLKIPFFSVLFMLPVILLLSSPQKVFAFSGSDFKPGRIIDDAIFFNGNAMNTSQIQSFLESKVPNCATGYTCLKDFRTSTPEKLPESGLCGHLPAKSNQSAAQIINDVAKACNVSPKVILVLLQKEMGLVTRSSPESWRFVKATGYGCPDSDLPSNVDGNNNGCYDENEGYFNQIFYAARVYKWYALNNGPNYKAHQNNYIRYHPNPACGGSWVYIENQATAGLYNYTPYQPSPATLAVGLGVEAPCGAYGNKNFWWYYNLWFGTPINDAYAWEVVQNSVDNKIYLISNGSKHYIPGPSIFNAWGFDKITWRAVDNSFVSSVPSGPNLSYVALDIDGTRYLMSSGKKHKLSSDAYVLAWGVAGTSHIWAPGYLPQVASGGNAGKFAKTADGPTYLLAGNSKHAALHGSSFSHWGISGSNTTVVTQDILDRLPTGSPVDRFVSSGGKKYIADKSSLLKFKNSLYEHAWGARAYVNIPSYGIGLYSHKTVGNFVIAENDSRWYFLEDGKRHHVPSIEHAQSWGWSNNNPLSTISIDLLNELELSNSIQTIVQDSSTNKYYFINKRKLLITDAKYVDTWHTTGTIAKYSNQSLSLLPDGQSIDSSVVGIGNNIFVIDDGILRHIPDTSTLSAFGAYRNNKIITLDPIALKFFERGSSVRFITKDIDGSGYYIDNGKKRRIDTSANGTWQVNESSQVSDKLLATLDSTTPNLGFALEHGGKYYLVNNRTMLDITKDMANYNLDPANFVSIDEKYLSNSQTSSHLVGTPSSNKVWLLASGKRYHIKNSDILSDLGYGKHSGITSLNLDIVSTLPEDTNAASRVLRAPSTGSIFAAAGKGYGFLDSATLNAYRGATGALIVSENTFNKFGLHGWTSQIAYANNGKVYAIENGLKRWVTSPSVLNSRYGNMQWFIIPASTLSAFQSGPEINN